MLKLKDKNRNRVILLILMFIMYLVVLIINPKPLDWSLSFSKDDSIPYGTEILFNELSCLYDIDNILVNDRPVYNLFEDTVIDKPDFIFINRLFKLSDMDLDSLLSRVNSGADAFVAAVDFDVALKDTLGFDIKESFVVNSLLDSLYMNFTDGTLKTDSGYVYHKAYHKVVFSKLDTLHTNVLGVNANDDAIFVKVAFGNGHVYLHTNPLSFTNYALLKKDNYESAFKALSYLRGSNVVWDEYYKEKAKPGNSIVMYILSQPALRYAWYIGLFGVLVYLVFGAKRKQRAIPVVSPAVNSSLAFVNTLGRLYFKRENHLDIAQKKYSHFLFYLRTKHYIDTTLSDAELKNEIVEKLNVPERMLNKLFSLVQRLKMDVEYTEDDLMEFSKSIEFIYNIIRYGK